MQFKPKTIHITRYKEVTSTNAVLKEMALAGAPEGTVILADSQTAGYGRRGRNFHSPTGAGLYMSILLKPSENAEEDLYLTAHTAVAVAKVIEKHTAKKAMIKWVNDVYLNERKVCGILTETFTLNSEYRQKAIIVGIGVNLKEPDGGYPKEIEGIAGAVFEQERDCDYFEFVKDILIEFFKDDPDLLDDYRARSMLDKKQIVVLREGRADSLARVVGIEDDLGLRVCFSDGREAVLRGGDVSIRTLDS